jgi:hypothetical protein
LFVSLGPGLERKTAACCGAVVSLRWGSGSIYTHALKHGLPVDMLVLILYTHMLVLGLDDAVLIHVMDDAVLIHAVLIHVMDDAVLIHAVLIHVMDDAVLIHVYDMYMT